MTVTADSLLHTADATCWTADGSSACPFDVTKVGGDDKPDRGHRGYGTKRATLKRDRDREFEAQIREMYRDLLGDPRTAERAEEIVAAVTEPVRAKGESESARESALMARAEAMRKRADAMDAEALQAEIALRLLYREMRERQEAEDFEAVRVLLAEVL